MVYIINNCRVIILTELIINKLLISTRTSQLRRKKNWGKLDSIKSSNIGTRNCVV